MNKAPPTMKTKLEKSLIETVIFYSICCTVMQGFKIDGFPCHTCPLMMFSAWCNVPSLPLASSILLSYVIKPTLKIPWKLSSYPSTFSLIFTEYLRDWWTTFTCNLSTSFHLFWRWKSTKNLTQKRFQSLKARKQPGIILLAGIYLRSLFCVLFRY